MPHRDVIGTADLFEKIEMMSENKKQMLKQFKSCKKWMNKHGRDFKRRASGFTLFSRAQNVVPPEVALTVEGKKKLASHSDFS